MALKRHLGHVESHVLMKQSSTGGRSEVEGLETLTFWLVSELQKKKICVSPKSQKNDKNKVTISRGLNKRS